MSLLIPAAYSNVSPEFCSSFINLQSSVPLHLSSGVTLNKALIPGHPGMLRSERPRKRTDYSDSVQLWNGYLTCSQPAKRLRPWLEEMLPRCLPRCSDKICLSKCHLTVANLMLEAAVWRKLMRSPSEGKLARPRRQ